MEARTTLRKVSVALLNAKDPTPRSFDFVNVYVSAITDEYDQFVKVALKPLGFVFVISRDPQDSTDIDYVLFMRNYLHNEKVEVAHGNDWREKSLNTIAMILQRECRIDDQGHCNDLAKFLCESFALIN
jgi:hypothetical protein